MNEFELKLVFPEERSADIEKLLVSKGGLRRQKLQAYYFDTPQFSLAKSGISLRIRKEGRAWIQTLKASGASQFERLEHNAVINHTGATPPRLNIKLHDEHSAYKALLKSLRNDKQDIDQLTIRYQTDIWRRVALVRARGAMLEYALDLGVIKAFQAGGKETVIPVREIEIASALLNSCLNQILPNVSEINADLEAFDEHIHQLRVGLRRLKSAMKVLGLIQIYFREADINQLSYVFGKLGQYRDLHFFDEKLKPAFVAVDAPKMNLSSVNDLPDPKTLLQSKNFQLFCLSIIELSLIQEKIPLETKRLKPLLIQELDKLNKDTKKIAPIFMEIADERRHKLRKRLKHLRYTLEFFVDFCDQSKYKGYLRSLAEVLDALGHYNDICVAIEKSQDRLSMDNNILFAMGWLKAEQTRTCLECANAIKAFSVIKKIW